MAATRCSEPSNYTNLQEAVLITRNPEDVKTSSAGGLVLTTNGGKKTKTKWGVGNNHKCTDSHCGPNYTFIVEISSPLLSDKTFLAKGQQLIAVIKPPFDFICSDGTKHDRRASDRQSDLLLLLLPRPGCCMRGRRLSSVFTALSQAARVCLLLWNHMEPPLTPVICIINKAQFPQWWKTVRLIFFSPFLWEQRSVVLFRLACVVLSLLSL